ETVPQPSVEEAPRLAKMSKAARGRALYMSACSTCHGVGGEAGSAPPLSGIIGRPIASVDGATYSRALIAMKGGAWTTGKLTEFLDNPEAIAPGTSMPSPGLFTRDVDDVVAFLQRQ